MNNQSPFEHLRHAAEAVTGSVTSDEKIAALIKAFELFNEETRRLEAAYSELRNQFKSANSELEESNRQLKLKISELDVITYYLDSILSNISQGILFIDLLGNVTTYNAAAEKILGVDRLDVLFQPLWNNFDDMHFGFSLRHALHTRTAPHNNFNRIVLTSGEERELEVDTTFVLQSKQETRPTRISPTLDTMQGLIIIIRDITELRRLQNVANRHDRMKELGEMAALVAHEIRNPLGGIKGFASLLERDLVDRPDQRKMAQYIVEGTDTLNKLVSNVLNYARPIEMHFETIDLIPYVNEIQSHLLADVNLTTKHVIKVECPYKKLLARIDPAQLKACLFNLLINSLQAMPDGGVITIFLKKEGYNILISVQDTGTGIPPENLEKIFSPFFTTKPEGNGFGLSEVLKIVQAHGGTIDVESTLDVGSTFTLRIPSPMERS